MFDEHIGDFAACAVEIGMDGASMITVNNIWLRTGL
jgi:hypothetical protein